MILQVDPADPTPVYEQLRAQVVRMVAAGTLTAGTRLPTIRQLATDLGIAKGTVARAYEALLRDGVVESAGRKGTIVAGNVTHDPAQRQADLRRAASDYAIRARQLGLAAEEAVTAVRDAWSELG